MATTIVTKNGSGAPAASDLVAGELAVDLTNGRLYTEDSGGSVIEIGLNPSGNVDVTGTVTSDGLTVVGETNSSNGTYGTKLTYSNGNQSGIIDTFGNHNLEFRANDDRAMNIAANGDISFYEDTGTTAKLFWDASAESLGIGTSSPSNDIHVSSATGSARLTSSAGGANLFMESADNNITRIRWNSNSDFAIRNDATSADVVTINSSGNVGIGATPEAWGSGIVGVDFGTYGSLVDGTNVILSRNAYYDSAWKYKTTDHASSYWQDGGGQHIWQTAASGSADAALTWSESMRIDSSGSVGIGTDSPATVLSIHDSADNAVLTQTNTANSQKLEIGNAYSLYTGGNGGVSAIASDSVLAFATADTERMRIDASGNLLVGKTASDYAVEGVEIRSNEVLITKSTTNPLNVRNGQNGGLIAFTSGSSSVGSIGVASGDNFYIGATAANHTGLQFADNVIVPMVALSNSDATTDLGASTVRFKDLYLSGRAYINDGIKLDSGDGIYFGQDGTAANKLDDYEEGTWSVTSAVGLTITSAVYTRVGRVVHLVADITFASGSASGSDAALALPFNNLNTYSSGSLNYTTHSGTPTINIEGHFLKFRASVSGSALSYANVGGHRFIFHAAYFAA